MSPRYLLDTDTISDVIRHPQGVVATRIGEEGERSICTSIVVAAEPRFGAAKRGSERLSAQLEAVLSALQILGGRSRALTHTPGGCHAG